MTASYTSERQQFGRPLATFQAVTQRLADQFINVGGIRLTTFSAAWRLGAGLDALEDTTFQSGGLRNVLQKLPMQLSIAMEVWEFRQTIHFIDTRCGINILRRH